MSVVNIGPPITRELDEGFKLQDFRHAPVADRLKMLAFLKGFSVAAGGTSLEPKIVYKKGTKFETVFSSDEEIGRGSFGKVYLYRAEAPSKAPFDMVCLKVMDEPDPYETAALATIARVNSKFARKADIGCDIINAVLLKEGPPTYVLMETGEDSLNELEHNLPRKGAIEVVKAMAIETAGILDTYGLLHSDIKSSNFVYTKIDDERVNVRGVDFGALREPNQPAKLEFVRHKMPADAYPMRKPGPCQEQAVFALGCTLVNLCRDSELAGFFAPESLGEIEDVYDHIALNTYESNEVSKKFRDALHYAFQIDAINGGAAGRGTTLREFIDILS